ncbi:MAG: hypothetical protein DI598_10635 [Pseudopedobacter saltans]|uniref:DUF4476 domain-containing protein n=1 Tax=Pseudopedobacter saltans TaxID=151895 RepID=A0A2W5EUZ3_9SPHI|nr:MAG: hypothetical protein DI598_10635 [Pseudopedobacter saltans]
MAFLKRFIFLFGVFILGLVVAKKANAQADARTHFIYIQSEGQQPFYVILNKKSYSSSSVGYLIISKLTDGDYNVTVGFPQDVYPAQTYLLKIKSTDAGFRLQKGTDNKWELIDKLSQNALPVVKTNTEGDVTSNTNSESAKSSSGFGALLSKTSNDTTNYKAYVEPKQNSNTGTTPKAVMEDNTKAVATNTAVKGRGKKEDTTADKNVPKEEFGDESYETAAARSATQSIVKIGEHSDRRGITLAFVVTSGDKLDTVSTFFPGDSKKSILEDDNEQTTTTKGNVSPEKEALKKEVDNRQGVNNPFYKGEVSKTTDNKSSNLGLFSGDEETKNNSKTSAKSKDESSDMESKSSSSKEIFNSTCTNIVTDKDVEKIRKKMIAKSSDEDMIAVVRKYVDTKCIYTAQVKELGGLLISDNGRFALYRILYPNVYDGNQYATLKDQLLDKNYKSQFDTLLSNR